MESSGLITPGEENLFSQNPLVTLGDDLLIESGDNKTCRAFWSDWGNVISNPSSLSPQLVRDDEEHIADYPHMSSSGQGQPIGGQYPGHVTTLNQWEALIGGEYHSQENRNNENREAPLIKNVKLSTPSDSFLLQNWQCDKSLSN